MNNDEFKLVVLDFLTKYNLKESTKPFLVAFSGGFDSMCLLHVLHSLGCNLIAIHLNHGWRGSESDNEELNCKNFCDNLGVEFYSELLSADIPHTETAARDERYKFFKRCAAKFNTNIVMSAHNANDNAETIIYRIAKGTALDGLCGILPKRDIFYRPLLNIHRADIERYCKFNKLCPNHDSSNDNIKYKRNLIRHKILPQLELINPNCVAAINSLSDCARYDCNYFDKFVQHIDDSTLNYKKADDSIKYRYIKHILVQNDLDYDKNKIELIKHFIDDNLNSKSGKTFTLSSELNLFVNASKIIVVKSKQEPIYDVVRITTEGIYEFNDKIFSITKAEIIPERFPQDSENYAFVELDNINFTLRTRRDGDIISPIGLNGHQKLKKYLNEKKIPSYIKDSLILLCNDNEVFWVAGVGLSDKIKVRNNVTHVLRISEK